MLRKPNVGELVTCLTSDYGIRVCQLADLPLGADANAAVYRATADDGRSYFLKLKHGPFDETSVRLPKLLSDRGIAQIIAPLTTRTGTLYTHLDAFTVILYPFVEGHNGYEVDMSERHWVEFGSVLKRIHTLALPAPLKARIRQETYSPKYRHRVEEFLARIEDDTPNDPIVVDLMMFLRSKRSETLDLVRRAAEHAQTLQAQSPEYVLCHSDIHAGNILIDINRRFFIVDWDEPIMAPKERDLMFVGGGQGFSGHTLDEEERLFYQGYGHTEVDRTALAYYRYERIVEDIAAFCEELLSTEGDEAGRRLQLGYLKSNYVLGGTIDVAHRSDRTAPNMI